MTAKLKALAAVTASTAALSITSIAQASPIRDQFVMDIPFSESSLIGSHNTYNTTAQGWGYVADPNHDLSIVDQLNEGINFVELDVHNDGDKIRLCHKVCGSSDKTLNEGLDKVREFLGKTKDENRVIVLYLEDYTKNHSRLAGILNGKLGDYIFKSNGCKAVPKSLTPRQVINANKRVVLYKGGGKTDVNGCSGDTNLKNMVFTDLGGISRHAEDRTNLSNIPYSQIGGKNANPKNLSQSEVVDKQASGTNLINLDFIKRNEPRAQLWSWAPSHPKSGAEICAVLTSNTLNLGPGKRWHSADCSRKFKFACQDSSTKAWKISLSSGSWSEGEKACNALGKDYFFSVPHNASQNLNLSNLGSNLWLNYTNIKTGQWEPVHHSYKLPISQCAPGKSCVTNQGDPHFGDQETVVKSVSGKALAVMQKDCNFVVYLSDKPVWASQTGGKGTGCQLVLQGDGNAVIYNQGTAIWQADSGGGNRDRVLMLSDDGVLELHDGSGNRKWHSQ